jgi:hypothetical protein
MATKRPDIAHSAPLIISPAAFDPATGIEGVPYLL